MAWTTGQMPQDAILGWARPRTMSRMYGRAANAVSALLRTVSVGFTARLPSRSGPPRGTAPSRHRCRTMHPGHALPPAGRGGGAAGRCRRPR